MDAARHPSGDGIIHKAMTGHARETGEARADDAHREMPPFARAGVAGVQVAVVDDLEGLGRQGRAQRSLDIGRVRRGAGVAHFGSSPAGLNASEAELMQKRSPVG